MKQPTRIAKPAGREVEHAGPLEEELSLLGEEQAEPREVDLLVVDFGLREIRVHREIERQVAR